MAKHGSEIADGVTRESDNILRSVGSASLSELMSVWRSRAQEEGTGSPKLFRRLGERVLALGEPLLAYDIITAGLANWPKDLRLRQLQGLALARSGASERAKTILEELRSEGQTAEETLGVLGRTYKDLAAHATSPRQQEQFFRRAAEIYGEAYRKSGGYWSGINAATLSLVVGETEKARNLASKVREQCLRELADPARDSYWNLAALGEVGLIFDDLTEAGDWYARAQEQGKGRFGDLDSSRRNARLILRHWKRDEGWIDNYLRIPSVVVFSGHMIDWPDRPEPRFPAELEDSISAEIQKRLDNLKPGFGFSSAACGSDILFLETMIGRGCEITIVLPYDEQEFVRDSVEIGPNASKWRERFERVLAAAARIITASRQRLDIGGVSYEFSNQLMLGLAAIRCRQLNSKLIPLAVWNGKAGDGPGGAASVVLNWQALGYNPEVIDLEKFRLRMVAVPPSTSTRPPITNAASMTKAQTFQSRIVAILFADVVSFSKLTEVEVPRFVEHFFGAIAKLNEEYGTTIIANNTWGDGLYFVFADVGAAAGFALELAELATATKWTEKGLPSELNLRIGLHAGPVYEFDDPITGRRNYGGTHVSRAARIEPVTPPGQVYASESFAALAAAQGATDFVCDYVGQTPMAKGYGTLPTYHVRPRRPSSTTFQ